MKSIYYVDRQSQQKLLEKVPGETSLHWLYSDPLGTLSLNLLIKRKLFSRIGGWYMNSSLSKSMIHSFIEEHDIDMSIFHLPENGSYSSFNEFFYRKIKPEFRPLGSGCISPADGKVLAFQTMDQVKKFFIKGESFSLTSFLNDPRLAQKYSNGSMLIVRLAPNDYHRFHFPANGIASAASPVAGSYYSVSPLALKQSLEIFLKNRRELATLESDTFGDILIAEVGATLVGSIVQTYKPGAHVTRGDEKGYFAFGGSTLVLLFEPQKIRFAEDLLENSKNGCETMVLMGDTIGDIP